MNCGICGREAEVMATVPMCGERPRYPLCHDCLEPIAWSGYAENVVPLAGITGGTVTDIWGDELPCTACGKDIEEVFSAWLVPDEHGHLAAIYHDECVPEAIRASVSPEATKKCGRLMVGSGTDTYDPTCELPAGHDGACRSTAAIDQHRLSPEAR